MTERKMSSKLLNLVRVCVVLVTCVNNLKAEPLAGKNVKKVAQYDLDFVASIAHRTGVVDRKDKHICSGALITPNHVLTHERCILNKNRNDVVVYVGSPDIKRASLYHVCRWIPYSSWYSETTNRVVEIVNSHIAILTLCKEVKPEISVSASISRLTFDELEGSQATVTGWGLLLDNSKSSYLRKASVKILARNTCYEFSGRGINRGDQYLCTRSDPFILVKPGDAGGPLLDARKNIIGVNSGTWYDRGHSSDRAINIHVNITHYRMFIKEITGIIF